MSQEKLRRCIEANVACARACEHTGHEEMAECDNHEAERCKRCADDCRQCAEECHEMTG